MRLTFFTATVLLLPLWAGAAQADAGKTPFVHEGPKVSVQAYGLQNPECLSWTDGCVLCATDAAGISQCSTPGIACQPRGLHCKAMRPK